MAKEIKGFCPNCKNVLYFTEGDNSVLCNCCDCTVAPEVTSSGASFAPAAAAPVAAAITFDSAESAIVYLENFFENYDWSEYNRSATYTLDEIEDLLVTNKSQNGANAFVWELDFNAVCTPVNKKLAALSEYEKEMADKYDPEDSTDAFETFDIYRKVINALDRRKDEIFKRLETDVKYAERFKLDKAALDTMKAELAALKKAFETSVRRVEKINDVPAYIEAKKKVDKIKKDQLRSEFGIDADEVYRSAVEAYNPNGANNNQALSLFEQIRGYSDSNEYIKKINKYFNYHFELFNFCGKDFVFRKAKTPTLIPAINLNKTAGDAAPTPSSTSESYSLYEVVNGKVVDTPIVQGIDKIVTSYGTRLYYFKKVNTFSPLANFSKKKGEQEGEEQQMEEKAGIFCFDFATNSENCLDQAPRSQYLVNDRYAMYFNAAGNYMYFKKKLEIHYDDKKGCKDKLFKTAPKIIAEANNYSLVGVNMSNNTSKVVIDAMVDVAEIYGDSLFFVKADTPAKKVIKEGEEMPKAVTHLMLCDLKTGNTSTVLSEKCKLHNVSGGKVIYSVWAPNAYNMDLRVYDLEKETDTLIESNVFDYELDKNGKIFYTVGNDKYSSLMCNNFEGTERVEVMQRACEIVGQSGNWIYIRRGNTDRNSALIKYRLDGKKMIVLSSQLKKFLEVAEDNVYYLDSWNSLHVVRPDGKEDRVIASDVDAKSLVLAENEIFYVRKEYVDNRRVSNSLYVMDLYGHNIRKLVFDIDKTLNYDENKLYYSKHVDMRYKVTVPAAKEKDVVTYYENHDLHKFFVYDKATGESTLVLTLGEPHGNTTFKKGCLKKETTADITYTEDPVVTAYKRTNLAKAGENTETVIASSENAFAGNNNEGCATILQKLRGNN